MRSTLFSLALLSCLTGNAVAAAPPPDDDRERVGLVLSGGGARGLAHIGVIAALQEAGIRIDAVVGTSMGAIVGALYASGRTPQEMREIVRTMDWRTALGDTPPRENLSFRRKQLSRDQLVKLQATISEGVVSLPRGAVQGQNLQFVLQRLFVHVSDVTDFDDLPIPFRAVAADLVDGSKVVLGSGSLPDAVRASMAIPGFFAPVERNGRLLVDGGIASNLPVSVAKAMGVDRVIAVDITSPLYDASELDSVLPIIEQLTTLLTFNQMKSELDLLGPDDLFIQPDLDDLQAANFDRHEDFYERGHTAVTSLADKLPPFVADGSVHFAEVTDSGPRTITAIRVDNDTPYSDKLIMAQVNQQIGQRLNRGELESDLQNIYGYGYFETVNYDVVGPPSGSTLEITVRQKSWGRDLLGVSFELFTDEVGDSGYNVGVNFSKLNVTRRGAEWYAAARLGEDPLLHTELYLPVDHRQIFFAKPYLRYEESTFNDVAGEQIRSRFKIDRRIGGSLFGLELSSEALVGVGLERVSGHFDTFIGDPVSSSIGDAGVQPFRDHVFYSLVEFDNLDSLNFPRSGVLASARYDLIDPRRSPAPEFEQLDARALGAVPFGQHSLVLNARYVRSYGAVSGRQHQPTLGGYLKLSGFPRDALVGDHLAYAGLTWLQRLDEQSVLPVDLPVYLGFTLEAGNTWLRPNEVSLSDMLVAGSLTLALETPLGPLYFGYGHAPKGGDSFYLKLGRLF